VTATRHPFATALLALPLAACSVVGIRSGTEEPRHEVLERLADSVEIRRYAPRLAAETTVTAADSDAARSAAFRRLARYIFGANQGAREIAMTAPVETGGAKIAMTVPVETAPADDDGPGGFPGRGEPVRMRFFLPAELSLATAPLPDDPEVRLVELPGETLAVRRFTGFWDDARLESELGALLDALAGSAWTPEGPPRAMFYDPPWTIPWLRRNEVALPVAPVGGE
jgi:hypothetical protein